MAKWSPNSRRYGCKGTSSARQHTPPKWKLILHPKFLPRVLASRLQTIPTPIASRTQSQEEPENKASPQLGAERIRQPMAQPPPSPPLQDEDAREQLARAMAEDIVAQIMCDIEHSEEDRSLQDEPDESLEYMPAHSADNRKRPRGTKRPVAKHETSRRI